MSGAIAVTDRSPTGSRHTCMEALGVTREDEEAHVARVSAAREEQGE